MNTKITLLIFFIFFVLQSCNIKVLKTYYNLSTKQLKLVEKSFETSDGYTIAYSDNEVKNKPVFVFIHGYMVSRYNFFQLAKKFKKDEFRYILLDVPGFGKSSKDPNGDYRITSQAKRFNELIKELNLTDVHLVGTSMGGAISIAINGMNSEIKSNTLLAPFGMPLYTQELPGVLNHFIETGEAAFIVDKPYNEKKTKVLFSNASNISSFLIPGFLLKEFKEIFEGSRETTNKVGQDMLYDTSTAIDVIKEHPIYSKIAKDLKIDFDTIDRKNPSKYASLLNLVNKSKAVKKLDPIGNSYENLIPYLEKINNPVLVIWGTKDNIIHYKTMDTMKPHIKNGTFKIIKNGSHALSSTKSSIVAKEMKKMISK